MCLKTIDEETKHYTEGYKVFDCLVPNKIFGGFYTIPKYKDDGYPVNEWIEDTNPFPLSSSDYIWITYEGGHSKWVPKKYQSGCHFFIDVIDAYYWMRLGALAGRGTLRIYKVEVDKCVQSGTQRAGIDRRLLKVGVAKRMKIIKAIS